MVITFQNVSEKQQNIQNKENTAVQTAGDEASPVRVTYVKDEKQVAIITRQQQLCKASRRSLGYFPN